MLIWHDAAAALAVRLSSLALAIKTQPTMHTMCIHADTCMRVPAHLAWSAWMFHAGARTRETYMCPGRDAFQCESFAFGSASTDQEAADNQLPLK